MIKKTTPPKSIRQHLGNLFDAAAKKRGAAVLCAVFLLAGTLGGLTACSPVSQSESADGTSANPSSAIPSSNPADGPASDYPDTAYEASEFVTYEHAEIRAYEDGSLYIHDEFSNHTDKTITGYERGMLAFDKDGNPLQLRWIPFSDAEPAYFYLYDWADKENVPPGASLDSGSPPGVGGWSIMSDKPDKTDELSGMALQIEYVLYCMKQITFDDGTVWENPYFDEWREQYEGKTIDTSDLQSYYPFHMEIG